MKTVVLKTKRLTLRTYLPGDEIQAHEYAGDTSITMMYWLPNKTFDETAEYIKSVIEKREQGLSDNLDFVIIFQDKIIGSIDLHFEEDKTTAYLGWVLKKEKRGFGFATEAAIAVRDYAFKKCGVTKLLANCDARNTASANVMKKIGMQCIIDNGTRTYPKTGEVAVEHVYELKKLNPSDFKIVDYFEMSKNQQTEIIFQLETRKDLWGAIPFIINCLKKEGQPQVSPTDGGFHDLLGPGRFFLMLDEANKTEITVSNKNENSPRLAAFLSLARNDEVDITIPGLENLTPWIGCVFTYPEYRGQRLSEKLISHAEEYAIKEFNAEYTYISTDHIGLYEKYGYVFFTEAGTVWGEQTRVLRKKL
ncbi:MAG: GNAT family N-acetyltransferase [Treponema sp.]|nr:GNAT family N-acetyltransferase [Treponema sp.]